MFDIVQSIFAFCDDQTNARNVLVCKVWSEVALNVVWSHLTDLKPLVGLFGLTRTADDNSKLIEYVNKPSVQALKRFETIYQHRIRILDVTSNAKKFSPVLDVIAKIRGVGPLLPNLESLTWSALSGGGLTEQSVMFMHDGIRSFSIISDEAESVESFTSYCEVISYRMPNLCSLELDVHPVAGHQKSMLALVQALPNLKTLTLPPFEDPSELLIGLRDLPRLRLTYLGSFQYDFLPPSSILNGPFRNTGFDHLSQVDIYCSYSFAAKLFQNISSSNKILTIVITSREHQPASDVREAMWQIASTCGNLQRLDLSFCNKSKAASDALIFPPPPDDLISFEDIEPLLQNCPKVAHFSIEHPYPAEIDDEDIRVIARSWLGLKTFKLGDQLLDDHPDAEKKLTLACLAHFSRHCPQIEMISLGLYADGDNIPDASSDEDCPVFQNLYSLHFGSSPIDNPSSVAGYLAHLCSSSRKPTLTYGTHWEGGEEPDPDDRAWREKWEAVKEVFAAMLEMKTRMENLMRKKEIEYQRRIEELEGLRVKQI
ncbi:hypothetical protein GYMLUDRAFT_246221 [Collybiopsis luxurians FD-317 M1]|uniref:F-box domain-containing protein n=1 Tax=Collybiopsis luxurians FD-317 M1 TaxID=944289 RepID=A0A0D0CIN9_9AGAR|nr:hypothetical protein GYMLUDRAFT_246221 [Collybiopsis luxurians FD-317 M1]